MTGSLSNYAELQMLRFLFTQQTVNRPASRYASVHTAAPGENGTNAEFAEMTNRLPVSFNAPSEGRVSSAGSVTLLAGSTGLVKLTHWSLWTNPSAGQCLGWGEMGSSIYLGQGGILSNEKPQVINQQNKTLGIGALYAHARGLSPYARDLALNWLFRNVAVVRPTAWFVALHFTPPDEDGVGGELTGTDAARRPVSFGIPAGGATSNQEEVRFGRALYNWPRLTHFTLWDASIAGNCLLKKGLKTALEVAEGEFVIFHPGTLKLSVN